MKTATVADAKSHLSALLAEVEAGQGVVITRQGKSVWNDEFEARRDPGNKQYFWLKGELVELDEEEDAVDAEANIVAALEEEPIDFGDKNEDTKDNKIENFSDYVKKDLVEIIRTSGLKKSVSSKHKKL